MKLLRANRKVNGGFLLIEVCSIENNIYIWSAVV